MLPSLSKCFCRFEHQLTSYLNFPIVKYSIFPGQNSVPKYFSNILSQPPIVQLHTSSVNHSFWEADRKGGYNTKSKEKISTLKQIRIGLKELKNEIGLWKDEVIEKFESDPFLIFRPGETDILWLFDDKSKLKNWVTTSDSDHNEGYSKCSFELSKSGRGLFSGVLDTRVPKDGRIKQAGYCALRSTRCRKSFKRDSYHDWSSYNTLVLKVRGDGRSYMINLSTEGSYDILWNDIYHFVLYTRGGPYWQVAKIPFSKFFLGSKGRIQDKQFRVPLDKISHVGFSCGDKINGPFSLEIEYIVECQQVESDGIRERGKQDNMQNTCLEFDPLHQEETAYEMYKTDKFIVGV